MTYRSDLAMECIDASQPWPENGITSETINKNGISINKIKIQTEKGSQLVGKPIGQYITIQVPSFSEVSDDIEGRIFTISEQLKNLLPKDGLILVVGLGNPSVTPDEIKKKTIDKVLATRHLMDEFSRTNNLNNLRSVAAVAFGVLGQTGIESSEIIKSIVDNIKPSAVIAVDALASRSLERLGTTIQLSDTGISPGSGVGNLRKELSKNTLGIPVIAVGVPTVVDCITLAGDLLNLDNNSKNELNKKVSPNGNIMMVTPREIDILIDKASYILSLGINIALQPSLSYKDIITLMS